MKFMKKSIEKIQNMNYNIKRNIDSKENCMSDNIKRILLNALKNIQYNQIILFGSRAKGNNREDSDYDILVIVNNSFSMDEIRKIECDIRKKMATHLIDVDVLVRTEKMISKYENVSGTVIHEAMKEGVNI